MIDKEAEQKKQAAAFELKKQSLIHKLNRLLKRIQKRYETALNTLETCLEWQKVQHEGQLLQANLFRIKKGMDHVTVPDWEQDNQERNIPLDPLSEPHLQVAKKFKTSKKLRTGIPHHQEQIKKIEKILEEYNSLTKIVLNALTPEELEQVQAKLPSQNPPSISTAHKALPFHRFYSAMGLEICVGKSAKNNEQLTFTYAKGSDWWLHVRDFSGSHIIIKVHKKQEPDAESLQDAMQLALYYSKAKDNGEADVCITQCKYVSRFGRGTVGKVHISKHKIAHVKKDEDRLKLIKQRGILQK